MNDITSQIIVALITALVPSIASVIAVLSSNNKNNALQDERIRSLKDDVATLSKRVEAHNNYGLTLTELKTRVEIIEGKLK